MAGADPPPTTYITAHSEVVDGGPGPTMPGLAGSAPTGAAIVGVALGPGQSEGDLLRSGPQNQLSQGRQFVQFPGDGQKVVARQDAHLAGELAGPIRQQDLRFAHTTRMQQDLARRGIAGWVFIA